MNQSEGKTALQSGAPAPHSNGSWLLEVFQTPPSGFGPVPFYWWAGESLERRRLAWQLDQLVAQGVYQVVISYPHGPEGQTQLGQPRLFSPAWWELFRWFLSECARRKISAGFQDYTLMGPLLQAIGADTPGMQGGQMTCVHQVAQGGEPVCLQAEPASQLIGGWAYPLRPDRPIEEQVVDLTAQIKDRQLVWSAPAGEWKVVLVMTRPNPFDPMHPESGRKVIDRFYSTFERECSGELGRSLKIFFQDELDFGSRMPFWSNRLRELFQARHGYDLWPWLAALWIDLGVKTTKIRLDYHETVVAELERAYFEPIFNWHQQRGLLLGHDNCGRGDMRVGREHYGDYFRTMRWYSAPGCDDPKLDGPRSFKGLKVNSSIAHLYQRPRVWAEAFHSSGWGTTPAEVVAAFNEDFALGATVVNLHGLYYTTYGGWWEWAPPDFHFRQPYWNHCQGLNAYFTRLSWLLSQGVHCCDVAIVYPSSVLESESANPAVFETQAHVGNSVMAAGEYEGLDAEKIAFQLGKYLFDRACDFDFLDFQSLLRSSPSLGALTVSGESYRVIVLPALAVVRYAVLEKLRDFVQSGGLLIALGCLPTASERQGAHDPLIRAQMRQLFGPEPESAAGVTQKRHPGGGWTIWVKQDLPRVLELIGQIISRDVIVEEGSLQVLHRRLEQQDIYYLFNPGTNSIQAKVRLRAKGAAELWNPWSGEAVSLPEVAVVDSYLAVTLEFNPREAKVLVIQRAAAAMLPQADCIPHDAIEVLPLEPVWRFCPQLTLDNTFGDFELPAQPVRIGPQARRFRYAEEFDGAVDWHQAHYDCSGWLETTYSYGPRFLATNPLPPGWDLAAVEKALLQSSAPNLHPGPSGFSGITWNDYPFSLRWGIEADPFLSHWKSGPHGLKGIVPLEYLDRYAQMPGTTWYFKARLSSPTAANYPLLAGGRCAYKIWVNGREVLAQDESLPPGLHEPWKIPHYEAEIRRVSVAIQAGDNQLLIRLTQPPGQRTRAFIAWDDRQLNTPGLSLCWFRDPKALRPSCPAAGQRRAIWFRCTSPPGTSAFTFAARGRAKAWLAGEEIPLPSSEPQEDGTRTYLAALAAPQTEIASVALRVEAPLESRAGDALPEPVRFTCGPGLIRLGDWSEQGLRGFSGIGEYAQTIQIPPRLEGDRIFLDLGDLKASAQVLMDGVLLGTLLTPPWRLELSPELQPGAHELMVRVANTLANFYSDAIPSPYALAKQTCSGLLGPVKLILQRQSPPQPSPRTKTTQSPIQS